MSNAKSRNTDAQAAQAQQVKLAGELGLTQDELEVVTAFVEVCAARIECAPIDVLLSTCETAVAKKFPGDEAAESALKIDDIPTDALKYIEDNVFGRAVGSLQYKSPVDNAKTQLGRASTRLTAAPTDPERRAQWAGAVRWLGQMRIQGEFKLVLEPVFHAFFRVQTGRFYQAPETAQGANSDVADDLALNM